MQFFGCRPVLLFASRYIDSDRTSRKILSLVKIACLLARYLAMDTYEPHRKHLFCCQEYVFIGPLPSNRSTLTLLSSVFVFCRLQDKIITQTYLKNFVSFSCAHSLYASVVNGPHWARCNKLRKI
jgi:hypothetical protein